ncbi:MAG: ABC transporter substrate-binding protein [Bacillota bacterium]
MKELNYVFNNKDLKIPINLYEAERYEFAVVVQPLIGNLVIYSNKGRYEPRIAKSWLVQKDGSWRFEFNRGFTCENGEEINPSSFKRSIETSIKFLAAKSPVPVLSKLAGYKEFTAGEADHIAGLEVSSEALTLRFSEPTRSGVVQILSFAPFGYICSENRNSDGSWKDENKFLSSGPYKLIDHQPGKKHVLERRTDWKIANINAPQKVHFYLSLDSIENKSLPTILDTFTGLSSPIEGLQKYNLVPEFINPILLGHNSKGKFFASRDNRLMLKKAIAAEKAKLPSEIENHYKTDYFYPNQPPKKLEQSFSPGYKYKRPDYPLIIQGKKPEKGDRKYLNWLVLEPALKSLGIEYIFDDSAKTWSERMSDKYDIRFHGSSIGGGPEAWGLGVVFCSEIGLKFPDPSGRVCNAVEDYEKGKTSDQEFSDEFNQAVFDDVSVIPITHYGVMMYLSYDIKRDSMSPLISVLRFEQLELE